VSVPRYAATRMAAISVPRPPSGRSIEAAAIAALQAGSMCRYRNRRRSPSVTSTRSTRRRRQRAGGCGCSSSMSEIILTAGKATGTPALRDRWRSPRRCCPHHRRARTFHSATGPGSPRRSRAGSDTRRACHRGRRCTPCRPRQSWGTRRRTRSSSARLHTGVGPARTRACPTTPKLRRVPVRLRPPARRQCHPCPDRQCDPRR